MARRDKLRAFGACPASRVDWGAFAEFLRVCSLYSDEWEVGTAPRGSVNVHIVDDGGYCYLEPAEARRLATVLLAAADEAERK